MSKVELTPEEQADAAAALGCVRQVREQLGQLCLAWLAEGVTGDAALDRLANIGAMIASDCVAFAGISRTARKMPEGEARALLAVMYDHALEHYVKSLAGEPEGQHQ